MTHPAAGRFWGKVLVGRRDECWPWSAGKLKFGYGMFRVSTSERMPAHRFAFLLAYGDFDRSLNVLHRCDNPPCCNPRHLFLGTKQDNNADARAKGRMVGPGRRLPPEMRAPDSVVLSPKHSSWLKIRAIELGLDRTDGLMAGSGRVLADILDGAMTRVD